jgi:tripartite-type tricarboxylate transporter receptor subunit TctC
LEERISENQFIFRRDEGDSSSKELHMYARAIALTAISALVSVAVQATGRANDFYQGKTITLVVSNAAGGGYDIYARLLAQYMPRHIPGAPTMIVENMPGANGLTMANYMWSAAPRDGTTIGEMTPGNVLEPMLGDQNAKFRAAGFSWLGTSASFKNDAYLLVVRSDSKIRDIEGLQKPGPPVLFGGSGAGGTDTDIVLLAKSLFRCNIKLIRGYQGTQEIGLAMRRGEVQGRSIGMSSLEVAYGDWLKTGKLNFLLQFGQDTRWRRLPGVPTAVEMAKTPDDKELVKLFEIPLKIARPFMAPPGMPEQQRAILENAFMATQTDKGYLAKAASMKLDISPVSGENIERLLVHLEKTPPKLIERYKQILSSN